MFPPYRESTNDQAHRFRSRAGRGLNKHKFLGENSSVPIHNDHRGASKQYSRSLYFEGTQNIRPDGIAAAYTVVANALIAIRAGTSTIVDSDTITWFMQAAHINRGGTGVGASAFLRNYTAHAAQASGISIASMDAISDNIGRNVLQHILATGQIAPMHQIVAMDIAGGVGFAGGTGLPSYAR
jgi:hypothetical protein